ncbi:MAG: carbamoyl-phosphate synthase large subunit, partial [Clostridiales bacterium]|nr:carbamoyl-phosphate synthase large subunit [Clostridiales bacterium]
PRVSRSSALASKATGYPIAKVSTKIAIGYRLDEIVNAVTGKTVAAFEPAIDYIAVKFPKWPFDKFVYARRELGTQMKATGEVMAIADSFEAAMMKAVRGVEIGQSDFRLKKLSALSDEAIAARLSDQTDERIFVVYEALARGIAVEKIYEITKIDPWFLNKLLNISNMEKTLATAPLSEETYFDAKRMGFPDTVIEKLTGQAAPFSAAPVYKMVDTCAAEFNAETPYFYASYNEPGGENEALPFIGQSKKQTVIVLGSGPIRIGQGIEFDYASVHCVWALQKMGYDVVIVNNNPETVSTDFDTANRLYFEPLTAEDVLNIIKIENPAGVVVAFGGQTAIKLTGFLQKNNIPIIGTSADGIDMAEDRERFDDLLAALEIKRPAGFLVMTEAEALKAANTLGYPVLMRPSYVLGGQNMIIAFSDEDIKEYIAIILRQNITNPVLIDKYLSGTEVEVDAVCDGENILIPGIMEHIERTGIHSGDSIAVYPAPHIDDPMAEKIVATTKKLCLAIGAVGLVNIQYIILAQEMYVIEVNPRASRTVPYLSKIADIPICELATRVSLSEKLAVLGYGVDLYKASPYVAVKVPVFSFEKLMDVDTQLGPEMKSTGEVLGIGKNLEEALFKGFIAAGYQMLKSGGVFITVKKSDQAEIVPIARKFASLGFVLYATAGTADVLEKAPLTVNRVNKIHEDEENAMTLLESGKIQYVISTSAKGRNPARDSVKIRRKASVLGIPCLTSIDTANAAADCLLSRYSEINTEMVDINRLRKGKYILNYTKMQDCGNDYIYIDCFNQTIDFPESLSVLLSDRHYGVGSNGIVLMMPSAVADAGMRMFNFDGSEGKMAGNAIRCVAKYLYDKGIVPKKEIAVETLSGVKRMTMITKNGLAEKIAVDMGKAELTPAKIPVDIDADRVMNYALTVGKEDYVISCVSMGNPHCVLFYNNVDGLDVPGIGARFEKNALFPEQVNTEFVQVIDARTVKMRVWERGNGETLACGTGACAAVVAAVCNGYCDKNADIRVIVAGGELIVNYADERVLLIGSAKKVFEGMIEI